MPDDTLDRVEQAAQEEQSAHLRAKVRQLESVIRTYQETQGAKRELIRQVTEAVTASEPYARKSYEAGDGSSSPIEAVLKISDWQIGEVIRKEETEGFGEFDWAIAQDRILNQLVPKVINWVTTHRHSFSVPRLNIFSESDHVSGDIHGELLVTNEFPLPVQTANAGTLFGEMVSRFAPHFDEVVIWEMSADNHGRLTKKSQAKQGARNNMSYLVHAIANTYLKKHSNVRIEESEGTKLLATVNGWRFLLEHGHFIKSVLSIPYYGLEREVGREARKRMNTDLGFDFLSCGHFHVPAIVSGNILINGCLTGTTEFDHACGRHAPPSQVSFLVHKKHGLFDWVPWKFSK